MKSTESIDFNPVFTTDFIDIISQTDVAGSIECTQITEVVSNITPTIPMGFSNSPSYPGTSGDGGWPTVAARQLRKFPSPRARWTGAIRYGESRGKGTETTQIRL